MSDLVERLRDYDPIEQQLRGLPIQQEAADEIERLRAVVDAVKDIKWRSIDKDNMEFATTCFVVDKIRNALAALEEK